MESIDVLGIPVAKLSVPEARRAIAELLDAPGASLCVYVNAHSVNLAHADPAYRDVVLGADLVLGDGAGVAIAARLGGDRLPANLNGSDFNPVILEEAAAHGRSVYFLGAKRGVADTAARALSERIPGLTVAGTHDGYFDDDEAVIAEIKRSEAAVLMVAMGNPRQELWLHQNLAATGATLGVGVGAFFDFSAGEVPRAPAWMNRAGIEWMYRLAQEPRRMWRRYVLGNPVFLWRVLRKRLARR